MKRIVRMLGLVMVLTALLAVSIAGTAFAANGNGPNGPNGECDGSGPVIDCSGPWGPYGSYGEGIGNSYGEPAQNCIPD